MKYQNTTLTCADMSEKLFQHNTFRVPAYQAATFPWQRNWLHGIEDSRVINHALANGDDSDQGCW